MLTGPLCSAARAVSSVRSERLAYTEEVTGSSPVPPTTFHARNRPPGSRQPEGDWHSANGLLTGLRDDGLGKNGVKRGPVMRALGACLSYEDDPEEIHVCREEHESKDDCGPRAPDERHEGDETEREEDHAQDGRVPEKEYTTGKKNDPRDDPRYGLGKYQRFRERVLRRDNWKCFVAGCATFANVLDHIIQVYPGMPGSLFFSEANARASCARHNLARGWKTFADRELGSSESRTINRDYTRGPYSFGGKRR